ncbi:MAG: hypothetical protein ABIL06_13125 [Pseudomonadota bacterium]|uniref:Uncharacterized protein n=1 Tax=viral metagenome TaxID=1070528 RepID=A0A6H1ZIK8_9ZZZZ
MSDQCKPCTARGKLEVCLKTECSYHDLWMVKALKTTLENEIVMQGSVLESVEAILNGEEVSDFELSFPVVRRVMDIKLFGWDGLGGRL